jgi:hypothetical protein
MENSETTKVRFDLWAVLTFVVLASVTGFIYLNSTLAEGRAARISNDHAISIRVSNLEQQFLYISTGITELKQGQKDLVDAMRAHEKMNGYKR